MAKDSKPRHPGADLNEHFLIPLGLSRTRLSKEIHVPETRISAITRGVRGITTDTALRLARYFQTDEDFWMEKQLQYDLAVAKQQIGPEIERDIVPIEIDP